MQDEQENSVDRRQLLRRAGTVAAGVAGAGVVAAVVASPAEAAPGGNVVLGTSNDSGTVTTSITANSATSPTLRLANSAQSNGAAGPALVLQPSGTGLADSAPTGSLSADGSGTVWSVFEVEGTRFPIPLYSAAVANITVPLFTPQRVLDTRSAAGRANIINPSGNLDGSGRVLAGKTININLGSYVAGAEGLFGNITVVSPAGGGFITVYPFNTARPGTSSINHGTAVLSNFTATGVGFDPVDNDPLDAISIFCQQTTHVVFDVMAFIVGSYDQILAGFDASTLKATESSQSNRREATLRAIQKHRSGN